MQELRSPDPPLLPEQSGRAGRLPRRRRGRGPRLLPPPRLPLPAAWTRQEHERPVLLEDWQRTIVEGEPWSFLRGRIRSDGCVFVNRPGRYQYLSYGFANYSADILDLVESTCRAQGLSPRRYARAIRLNRREDVARLVEHVGLKS